MALGCGSLRPQRRERERKEASSGGRPGEERETHPPPSSSSSLAHKTTPPITTTSHIAAGLPGITPFVNLHRHRHRRHRHRVWGREKGERSGGRWREAELASREQEEAPNPFPRQAVRESDGLSIFGAELSVSFFPQMLEEPHNCVESVRMPYHVFIFRKSLAGVIDFIDCH